VRLVAVADVFGHRIQACLRGLSRQATQVDVPKERQFVGLSGFRQLMETDCDVVILATPPGFRPLQLDAAIAAGKHVFMEKPVSVDAPGVRQVLAATQLARQKNLALGVGLQRRHEPRYRETIARLQQGAIGDMVMARVYWNGAGVAPQPRTGRESELEHQLRNWQLFPWLSGDAVVEQLVHNIDVINWLKNDYPVSANGMGGRAVRRGPEDGQVFDHHCIEYTYADGSKLWSQCRQMEGCWNSVAEHVHCTEGTADISGGRIKDAAGKTLWQFGKGPSHGWQAEMQHFFGALRAGEIPNEGYYGAMSTMTAILGRAATYSGQVVSLPRELASDERLAEPELLESLDDAAPVVPDASGVYRIARR
jgi:predicted dehydrogenase